MNLSQYRDLLQDLQDDIDNKEKSVLAIDNLKEYARKKLENPENSERYRSVLIEATRDLNIAQTEVEELRALAQHVQAKMGEAIKRTPASSSTTQSAEQERPQPLHRNEAQTSEAVASRTEPRMVERSVIEPHSKTVVDQVVDDGSDIYTPHPAPVPKVEQPLRRSSVEIEKQGGRRSRSTSQSKTKVSSSSETLQSSGDVPLVNVKPIEIPPELEEQRTASRTKRVSLDSEQTRGTVEFGEEDFPIRPGE